MSRDKKQVESHQNKNATRQAEFRARHAVQTVRGMRMIRYTLALATIATLAAAWWSVLPDHHGKPSANGVRVMRVLCATPHGARHASCTAHTGEGP